MRYRTAFLGIVFGGMFIIGFAMRGGMAMWIAVLFFAAHFADDCDSADAYSGTDWFPDPFNDLYWTAS